MDSQTKSKLEAVLGRKALLDAAALAEQREREESAQKKEAEKKAIRERWAESVREIDAAIATVNSQIYSANLKLSVENGRQETGHPGLAQLVIHLHEPYQPQERRLVLNVSALGLVQLVTLIPHSGPRLPHFNINDANQEKYEAVLVEFIGVCFSGSK